MSRKGRVWKGAAPGGSCFNCVQPWNPGGSSQQLKLAKGAIADRLQGDGPGQGDEKRPWSLEEKGQEIPEGDVGRDKNRVKR